MKVSDMDELVFLWKEYGKVHDERLTKDAQDLKQQVRGFVQSLPTFHEKAKCQMIIDRFCPDCGDKDFHAIFHEKGGIAFFLCVVCGCWFNDKFVCPRIWKGTKKEWAM